MSTDVEPTLTTLSMYVATLVDGKYVLEKVVDESTSDARRLPGAPPECSSDAPCKSCILPGGNPPPPLCPCYDRSSSDEKLELGQTFYAPTTTYFYEQKGRDANASPSLVVTLVYAPSRNTPLVKYGACLWRADEKHPVFTDEARRSSRATAISRFEKHPVTVMSWEFVRERRPIDGATEEIVYNKWSNHLLRRFLRKCVGAFGTRAHATWKNANGTVDVSCFDTGIMTYGSACDERRNFNVRVHNSQANGEENAKSVMACALRMSLSHNHFSAHCKWAPYNPSDKHLKSLFSSLSCDGDGRFRLVLTSEVRV